MSGPLIPLTNPNVITQPGATVDAPSWTTDWSTIVNYINNELVALWNIFQNPGDILVYNGTNVGRLAVGTNGQFLQANSSAPLGVSWASAATLATLTTAGDMLYYNSGNTRLPIGTAGQVLTVSNTGYPSWVTGGVPAGIIALWSGSIATIPSGWVLCNGQNGTPNLQGLFVVGAGNSSPAATNGMGLIPPNTQAGDIASGIGVGASYAPACSVGLTSGPIGYISYTPGGAGYNPYAVTGGGSGSVSPFTVTPQYYALCYIMST